LPVAVYFLLTGAIWQGVVLIAFGVLVIGLVDNILRPVLVGKDTKMPESQCFCINYYPVSPAQCDLRQ
jgi:predicted PurR-regulated permease PerM